MAKAVTRAATKEVTRAVTRLSLDENNPTIPISLRLPETLLTTIRADAKENHDGNVCALIRRILLNKYKIKELKHLKK